MIPPDTVNAGVAVTVAIFCIGVVYQCGRLSARVDALEEWRRTLDRKFDGIHESIREVQKLITGEGI